MELTFDELNRYTQAFPIAYYAGQKIELLLTTDSVSFADIVNNKIYISHEQVNRGLAKVDREDFDESYVRPLVYHEVDHVIFTPKCMAHMFDWRHQYEIRERLYEYYQSLNDPHANDKYACVENVRSYGDIFNVFCDERIERLTDGVYKDVDFFDNCIRINNYQSQQMPNRAMSYFYGVVRFHENKDMFGLSYSKFYNESRQLLIKYADILSTSPEEDAENYLIDILKLYADMAYEFETVVSNIKSIEQYGMPTAGEKQIIKITKDELRQILSAGISPNHAGKCYGGSEVEITPELLNAINEVLAENKSDKNSIMQSSNESEDESAAPAQKSNVILDLADEDKEKGDDESEEDDDSEDDEEDEGQLSDKATHNENTSDEDDDDNNESTDGDVNADSGKNDETNDDKKTHTVASMQKNVSELRSIFKKIVKQSNDAKVSHILERLVSKRSLTEYQASATHRYSGKLDAKAVGRDDWKIFLRKSSKGGEAKLGKKLNLILILDQSGSYSENDEATNKILKSIVDIEKSNPNFNFDIVKFENNWRVCKKDERISHSQGGTTLHANMFKWIKEKMLKPDYMNYIIMLNDGEAWIYGEAPICLKNLLNSKNVAIICDKSAEKHYKECKRAKTIVVEQYGNYPKLLSENVCEILNEMMII